MLNGFCWEYQNTGLVFVKDKITAFEDLLGSYSPSALKKL
jgi:hypothetical protein